MRKFLCILAICGLLTSMGCMAHTLKEDTLLNPGHWWVHTKKVLDEFHQFRIDIDRTVFGLEDTTVERF